MKKILFAGLLVLFSIIPTKAQVLNPVSWKFSSKQIDASTFELSFTATIDEGWHMYGLNIPENGPVPTSFNFEDTGGIEFVNNISPAESPEIKFDPTFEMEVELFSEKAVFTQQVKLVDNKEISLTGSVEFMACDDSRCLPPKDESFEFILKNAPPVATVEKADEEIIENNELASFETERIDISTEEETINAESQIETAEISVIELAEDNSKEENKEDDSLLKLFLLAFIAGFGALLTPCVYPIIPLTVSFFMRDTSRSKAIYNGIVFGISIIFIYTFVGFLVGIFKIDLVTLIRTNWIPNLIFLLIFLLLAFSFFGMFEITLPGSLSNKIDQQADKGGILGPFFMALATVVISFSCTGPIVGVALGSALQGEVIKPVIGMLGFSISFALPFTLLAIFPGFMNKLPKSGGWLNAVKVFFAFILLAFSLMFLGNLGLNRTLIIALAIVIFTLLGFYLLGKIQFSHDSPVPFISVPRIMLAILTFSAAVYLVTGLFGAPLKSISPFLPPPDESSFNISGGIGSGSAAKVSLDNSETICSENPKYADFLHLPHGLKGYFDYEEALACAKELDKPVLLDFAGHSCKNCKKMYAEVWSDPRVLEKLSKDFVIVALYTDERKELSEEDWITSSLDGKIKKTIGKKFNDLQIEKFGSNALPLYAIVDADGNILTDKKYHTYSSDVNSFLEFLEDGLGN